MFGCAGDRNPNLLLVVKPSQGLHNWSGSEAKYREDSIHPARTYFTTSSSEHMALSRSGSKNVATSTHCAIHIVTLDSHQIGCSIPV